MNWSHLSPEPWPSDARPSKEPDLNLVCLAGDPWPCAFGPSLSPDPIWSVLEASFHIALGAPAAHAHGRPLLGHPFSGPPGLSRRFLSSCSLCSTPSSTFCHHRALYVKAPTANRITWKVLSLQDPLQLYCPGLLPDKQGSHQTRPEALGPRKELPTATPASGEWVWPRCCRREKSPLAVGQGRLPGGSDF